MELNLDSKVVQKKITLGGKAYPIKALTVKAQLEMQKALKGMDQSSPEYFEETVKHLAKVGLPEAAILDMDAEQMSAFVEFISGQEKK